MRKTVFVAWVLAALMQTAQAAESEFQITPRVGQGELEVDAFDDIPVDKRENDVYELGIGFGFVTPIGVLVELGMDSHGRLEWLNEEDDFALSDRYVAVGYQFELGDGWRLIPKVGRSKWKLESDNGLIDISDDNDRVLRGYENFFEATIARRVSRVVALGLSYKHAEYDFGRSRALAFVTQIAF